MFYLFRIKIKSPFVGPQSSYLSLVAFPLLCPPSLLFPARVCLPAFMFLMHACSLSCFPSCCLSVSKSAHLPARQPAPQHPDFVISIAFLYLTSCLPACLFPYCISVVNMLSVSCLSACLSVSESTYLLVHLSTFQNSCISL